MIRISTDILSNGIINANAFLLVVFLCFSNLASARTVRVASYNILYGIGKPNSREYKAVRVVLKRIHADVIIFQELNKKSISDWEAFGKQLGYPYIVVGERGPFSGSHLIGCYSRFEYLEVDTVKSPEGYKELSRAPLRVTIDVPFAKKPLTVWGVHQKSGMNDSDGFRRAIEAKRIISDINAYTKKYPTRDEYIVLGDFNDDMTHRDQIKNFLYMPRGLPKTLKLGKDIKFPMRYKTFPIDHYSRAGKGMTCVKIFQTNTDNPVTLPKMRSILDYIFVSNCLAKSPLGPPKGEIYNSAHDVKNAGMKKWPMRVYPTATKYASDHLPIFVDVHMEDAPFE